MHTKKKKRFRRNNGLSKRQNNNMSKYSEVSQYDPKIHSKTKGGYGFGMRRGIKEDEYAFSGVHLASVFGWEVPENLRHIKEAIDRRNGRKL
jgi:hypothetical protein